MILNQINTPSGWLSGDVLDFLELKRGHDLPVQERCDGEFPIIGSNGIAGFHSEAACLSEGVITGRSGTLGKVYFSSAPYWPLNTSLFVNDFKGNFPKYCYYFLKYFPLSKFGTGTGVPTLNRNVVHKQKVTFPPLEEQQKIAEVLSTVDQKIDLIDQKITETQKLKTGLMQKLFSEGVGVQDEEGNWQPHAEYKGSSFGSIPKKWSASPLSKVLDVIKDGTHFSPKSKEGPCKYLTSKNIRFGVLDLKNMSYISQEEHDKIYKSSPVKYGDILLTKDGANTGNAAINTLTEPFSLLSSVAYLRGDPNKVSHGYILQMLLSPKGQAMMKLAMTGQAITRLTLKKIGDFILPIAPIEEQKEIDKILSTCDEKIALLIKQKAETQQLKKGLMQKLLTGEWRVPLDNH